MSIIHHLLSHLPLTRIRLLIAGLIYGLIHPFFPSDRVQVRRRGIRYDLDLTEGIDLSIFIFGQFQPRVFNTVCHTLPDDALIVDVGANIGSMALTFARHLPRGRVHAFEPANEAYGKLMRNLALNPDLKPQIMTIKAFASDRSQADPGLQATASWKINDFFSPRHPISGGMVQNTGRAPSITLDDYCRDQDLRRLDLIKIDTEGQERAVIGGALACIARFKPLIIFEAGHYLMHENGFDFKDIESLIAPLGYRFFTVQGQVEVTRFNARSIIPRLSTIDIIARAF